MRVEQVAHLREVLALHRELQLHELALDAAVGEHHHGDKARRVDGDQLKAADRHLALVVGHGIGRVADERGDHLPRLAHHLIELLHRPAERGINLVLLLLRERPLFHQLVDVEPVALRRRDAPGGGVRLLEIAHLLKIGQLVAHGGGADLAGHLLDDGLGANRLGGGDIALHHDL